MSGKHSPVIAALNPTFRCRAIGLGLAASVLVVAAGFAPTTAKEAAASPGASACAASLTLVQRPGYSFQGTILPSSPDTPPNPVTIQVPLYPGAVPTDEHMYVPGFNYLGSPYVKTAVAEFGTSDPLPIVEGWYREQFTACGYDSGSSGSSHDAQGHTSDNIEFLLRGAAYQEVAMVFELGDSGKTLILYNAVTATVPPRPAASYLPGDIVKVTLAVFNPGAAPAARSELVTTRRTGQIQRLVQAINSLSQILGGEIHCPITAGAMLGLRESTGRNIVVEDYLCPGVTIQGYPTLVDSSRAVWKTIRAIVRKQCPHGRCRHGSAGHVMA